MASTSGRDAFVEFERVQKSYDGETLVVKDLNLSIPKGEFLTMLGPSGSGKTTCLMMLAGFETATHGDIRLDGRPINHIPPHKRGIGMVFQNYALYPHMTVYKNMAFGLKMRKVPRGEIKDKVTRAARMLGIEHLLERKPKALSGGERQRVAVGRAIVRTPQAFLFDEPLSNLDARLRVQMRAELKKLHRELQTTAIYVTHDQEEAMTLGDRIAVMRGGVVQQCASPLDVYARPVNRFVAGFVGMPPMNFFEGRIAQHNGRLAFDTGFGMLAVPVATEAAFAGRIGDPMVYGARPEVLSLHAGEPSAAGDNAIGMRVTVIETLGSEKDVYLETPAGQQVVARIPAESPVEEGKNVSVSFDVSRVHVFETGVTGVNVGLNGYGAVASAN